MIIPTYLSFYYQLYGTLTVLADIEPEAEVVISKHLTFYYQAEILFVEIYGMKLLKILKLVSIMEKF
jgi:hypothetical protein